MRAIHDDGHRCLNTLSLQMCVSMNMCVCVCGAAMSREMVVQLPGGRGNLLLSQVAVSDLVFPMRGARVLGMCVAIHLSNSSFKYSNMVCKNLLHKYFQHHVFSVLPVYR